MLIRGLFVYYYRVLAHVLRRDGDLSCVRGRLGASMRNRRTLRACVCVWQRPKTKRSGQSPARRRPTCHRAYPVGHLSSPESEGYTAAITGRRTGGGERLTESQRAKREQRRSLKGRPLLRGSADSAMIFFAPPLS